MNYSGYGSAGIGKGVLVIMKSPEIESEVLEALTKRQKALWKVQGDLIFLDSEKYLDLSDIMPFNKIIPLEE